MEKKFYEVIFTHHDPERPDLEKFSLFEKDK